MRLARALVCTFAGVAVFALALLGLQGIGLAIIHLAALIGF